MKHTTSLDVLYQKLLARKVAFFVAFFVTILVTYGVLYSIDFIPEPISEETPSAAEEGAAEEHYTDTNLQDDATQADKKQEAMTVDPLPTKIIFDALDGREVTVLNPTEATIAAMDEALLSGVVRHPDSADFQNTGNMLLLGHSSYLPNVFNKNFQAFNGIQNMSWGDTVRLQSGDTEYIYRVQQVREEKSTEVVVPYEWGPSKLTLVTCNVYGAKEDRFIVEAVLVSTRTLS